MVKDFLESNAQVQSTIEIAPVDFTKPENKPKELVEVETPPTENYLRFIEAKTSMGEIYLRVEECYFFETIEERYYVEHPKGRFRIEKPLYILEEELNPLHFFRGHRSYIFNLNYLDSYAYWEKGKYLLYIKGTSEMREMIMSRNRFSAFRDALTANRRQPVGLALK